MVFGDEFIKLSDDFVDRRQWRYDPPESLTSVGVTYARRVELTSPSNPFPLERGGVLESLVVEYETYGELSSDGSNAILVTHALSGDAHAAGWDGEARRRDRQWRLRRPGWWDGMIGPGKPLDTNRFFIICANVIGSCYGTTGPASINPATGRPYGLRFPEVTVGDWVCMEAALLDRLGIDQLYAVCGGSLGGQQALEWALRFPDRVGKCLVLASGPKLPTQGVGFNAVGRHAILHDPYFRGGDYYGQAEQPRNGLAVARMLAHITYQSGKQMDSRFGRKLQEESMKKGWYEVEYAVESYLNYQGRAFVERFDANSYLYMTKAMDHYDAAAAWGGGDLLQACKRVKAEMLVAAFSTDWLYPPEESSLFVKALLANRIPVTYVKIDTIYGHDAFLLEIERVGRMLRAFLLSPMPSRRTQAQYNEGSL